MSKSEFNGKNKKDLLKTLAEKRDALQDFKLGNARSKTKDVKAGKNIRKDIARIMTELTAQARSEATEKATVAKK